MSEGVAHVSQEEVFGVVSGMLTLVFVCNETKLLCGLLCLTSPHPQSDLALTLQSVTLFNRKIACPRAGNDRPASAFFFFLTCILHQEPDNFPMYRL